MILSNIALQIGQVLCVLLLAPLLQGFILKTEEQVQRSRGPSVTPGAVRASRNCGGWWMPCCTW